MGELSLAAQVRSCGAAVEEWQTKRSGTPGTPRLSSVSAITTGFLDGTHPIVDAYELKVGATISWHHLNA